MQRWNNTKYSVIIIVFFFIFLSKYKKHLMIYDADFWEVHKKYTESYTSILIAHLNKLLFRKGLIVLIHT